MEGVLGLRLRLCWTGGLPASEVRYFTLNDVYVVRQRLGRRPGGVFSLTNMFHSLSRLPGKRAGVGLRNSFSAEEVR